YVGFVAIHPNYRGTGLFEMMARELYRVVSSKHGVAAFDVCRRNQEIYRLPQTLHRLLEASCGFVRSDRMDGQSYWLCDFPQERARATSSRRNRDVLRAARRGRVAARTRPRQRRPPTADPARGRCPFRSVRPAVPASPRLPPPLSAPARRSSRTP